MNNHDFQNLEKMTQEIEMDKQFKSTLEDHLVKAHHTQQHKTTLFSRWRYLVATLALAIIVALTPLSGLAQQIIEQFFTRHSTDRVPATMPQEIASSSVWFEATSITEVEDALQINLMELDLPAFYRLQSISYSLSPLRVTMVYNGVSGHQLIFTQGESGWATRSSIGMSAAIQSVKIGMVDGEYVEGFWINDGEMNQWHNNSPFRRLRWQVDDMQYEIFSAGGSEDTLDIDLTAWAENMR